MEGGRFEVLQILLTLENTSLSTYSGRTSYPNGDGSVGEASTHQNWKRRYESPPIRYKNYPRPDFGDVRTIHHPSMKFATQPPVVVCGLERNIFLFASSRSSMDFVFAGEKPFCNGSYFMITPP
jgi:hypothetical protein